jgi:hypothetical protein
LFCFRSSLLLCKDRSLKGSQLAYHLKKRNPKLYQRAKEVKKRYNITWNKAFTILRGEKKPPTQPAITGSEVRLAIGDVAKRVEAFEKRVSEFGRVLSSLIQA